jgi:hypothetical protein
MAGGGNNAEIGAVGRGLGVEIAVDELAVDGVEVLVDRVLRFGSGGEGEGLADGAGAGGPFSVCVGLDVVSSWLPPKAMPVLFSDL